MSDLPRSLNAYNRLKQIVLFLSLIVILTYISFLSSLDNDFTNWDDDKFVTKNPLIRELSYSNIKVIFTSFYKETFHQPLVLLSFSLEYHFFQLDPFIYHLTNLILHILNSLLVFYVIFLLSDSVSISFVAALLFGVHPLHVESVVWISQRKDVLSTFFFVQAIIFYLIYKRRERRFYYYLSLSVFVFSLLSKGMTVTLPFVLFLCDYLSQRRINKGILLEKVPFLVISAIFGAINLFIHQSAIAVTPLSPLDAILIACRGVIFYLTKTLLPLNLSAHYPYPNIIGILIPEFFFSVILISIIGIAVFYTRRYTRKIIFGSLLFLITILPVLKLVPFGGGEAAMADRYMYIPSIGLFYMMGATFDRIYTVEKKFKKARRVSLVVLLSLVILSYSVLTYERSNIWQDDFTLWADTVKKSPDNPFAHFSFGIANYKRGMLDRAILEYREALKMRPFAPPEWHYNLALAYYEKGLLDDAIHHYKKAIDYGFINNADTHINLGNAYADKGLLEEAIAEYKEALRIEPNHLLAIENLNIVTKILEEKITKEKKLPHLP